MTKLRKTPNIDNSNKVSFLFFLRKQKTTKRNESPIYARITVKGKRKEFSTGITVAELYFEKGAIKCETPALKQKHFLLEKIASNMDKAILACRMRYDNLTIDIIENAYAHGFKNAFGLFDVLDEFMKKRERLIDLDIVYRTFIRNVNCVNLIKEFVKVKLDKNDIVIEEIRESFANDLYLYLRADKKYAIGHIKKVFDILKMTLNYAVLNDYVYKNYLAGFRIKDEKAKEIKHLNSEQLYILRNTDFEERSLTYVRDCFLFQCFTGMAYADLYAFTVDNINVDNNGNKWIILNRSKSGSKCTIPILKEAEELILKYKDLEHRTNSKIVRVGLLPVYSCQVMNKILRKIAVACKIPIDIMTTHTARKTFAMTALNKGNISIETVSKILGHSKISMTQRYYGYVNKNKILNEMNGFEFISN